MNWFESIPKVELHLHIEGAIPLPALWTLVEKYGGDESVPTIDALYKKFTFRDFPHFIETWIWKNNFLLEYEDFTFIAEAVARDLAQQNIRYVEAYCSPPDFKRYGLQTQALITALREGLDCVPEIEVALIPDMSRGYPPEDGMTTLYEVNEVKELGVLGIGLGGPEQDFPPELFSDVFATARQLGLHTCAHAGEAAGAESIWGALHSLQAERIGHGTRAFEDPELLDYLVENQIPVEMNPISNVCTGVVESYEAHPIGDYYKRGMMISVNTDDPKMFGNSLAEEYNLLVKKHGFSQDDVRTVILNGIHSSWLPKARKNTLIEAFTSDPAW